MFYSIRVGEEPDSVVERISKTHQSTKAGNLSENGFLFEECITAWIAHTNPSIWDPIRDFLGRYREGIGMEYIDSYRYRRKGSLLIQTLYLRDRDREEEKTVLLIEKEIRFISYLSLNEKMGQILQDQTGGT
ncbi:hypothetical protein O6P43_035319 [Quillaja saponaria]|uniref:Uncharacterized protein n=1 Tax=Quillaja saponaria TaxID=32244 RepID=A0AAD7KLE8_QUISA|nr:hypothetical protein O6P43_035319 [Quillaja saponaria]